MGTLDDEEVIFNAALDRAEGQTRSSFLDEACNGDRAFRFRIEQLLSAYDQGECLNSPVSRLAVSAPPTIQEKPGAVIGAYKLLEQIGEGGMGLVFMAEQTQPLRRRVALKIIKPGLDTLAVIARFEAERQALALMDHPNIARVFEAGATESGRPYFVMELVRGAPITEHCIQHELELRRRLELFIEVCQAIQHAHEKGIIHRDLKPTNILVAQSDTAAIPKVIDFGVAKATTQQLTERTLFTHFAQIIGTPLYMSPEQADIGNQDVDTRSDVYSLGVVLYELLTETTPFDPERLRCVGQNELRRIIREEEPPKPSTRATTIAASTTTVNSKSTIGTKPHALAIKGDLDWIVMKAMEKDRRRRYSSPSELAADVRRHLDDQPVEAAAPSALYRARKFVRRNRLRVLAAALVLVAGTVAIFALAASTVVIAQALAKTRIAERQASADRDQFRSERDRSEANLYVADVRLAHEEWRQSHVAASNQLLAAHIPRKEEADLRGWEWYYLASLSHRELATLGDTSSGLGLVDWSPDGLRLATADNNFEIKIWDVATERVTITLRGHKDALRCLAWSPDGHKIASAGYEGKIYIWDVDSASSSAVLPSGSDITCVSWSPDGKRLASADADGQLKVWDPTHGRELFRMEEQASDWRKWAWAVVWSPDGRRLASAGNSNTINIWDASSGKLVASKEGAHNGSIHCLAWNSDGNRIASGSGDSVVKIWDVESWQEHSLLAHNGGVSSVAWSPDGSSLVSAGGDGVVNLWNAQEATPVRLLRGHLDSVRRVCWKNDGARLASASWDGMVKLWDPSCDQEQTRLLSNSYAAWSPDGQKLAALIPTSESDATAAIQLFDKACVPSGAPMQVSTRYGPLAGLRNRVEWSPNGKMVAFGFSNDEQLCIQFMDVLTKSVSVTFTVPNTGAGEVRSIAFSPDSRRVAAALFNGSNNEVVVWEISSRKQLATLPSGETFPTSVAWSPDGRRLASTYFDQTVRLWNTTTWKETLQLDRQPQDFRSSAGGPHILTWSRDGAMLASGNVAGKVVVWNPVDGRELLNFSAHASQVFSIAFSPDGSRLATGGEDKCVKISDVNGGKHLLTLRGHRLAVRDVAWNADGSQLLSSDDEEIFVWSAPGFGN